MDHFIRVNDTNRHAAGDFVLSDLADHLAKFTSVQSIFKRLLVKNLFFILLKAASSPPGTAARTLMREHLYKRSKGEFYSILVPSKLFPTQQLIFTQ
ncbi:MAG: diguanylate cyclase [Anaerolineales bacterium]|nr:diguanylate cyclase [Anaerolineales bacterium]